jgi:photosystem II stability/assembly factor-like uncharacterized protein
VFSGVRSRLALRGKVRAAVVVAALGTGALLDATPASAAAAEPAHWVDKSQGLPDDFVTAVAVDPFDARVVYVGFDGFLFRSDDGGDTYSTVLSFARGLADDPSLTTQLTDDATAFDEGSSARARDPADDAVDDQNDVNDGAGGVVDDLPDGSLDARARDSGLNDIPLAPLADLSVPPHFEPGVRSVAFSTSPGMVLVATPRGLYRSVNQALSFERLRLPGGLAENDIRDVAIDRDRPSRYYVGTAAGLFITKDGGASFDRANGRIGTTGIVAVAVDRGTVLVGSERGLLRSRDGGDTWNDLLLRGAAAFPLIHAVAVADGGALLYAGIAEGLFAAERNSPILEQYDGMPNDPPTQIVPDPQNIGGVVVASRTNEGGAFFSNDIGLTSSAVEPLPATQVVSVAREPKNAERLWAATERGVFRLEPGTGIRVTKDGLAALRARFDREPDLSELTARALAHSHLDLDVNDAQHRAGLANLLPLLELGYQFDAGDTNQVRTNLVFTVGVGQPPTSDPDAVLTDRFGNTLVAVTPTQQLNHRVWLNLTWELDRVVLPQQTALLGRNAAIAASNENTVADNVRGLYIMRRRLLAQSSLDDQKRSRDPKTQLKRVHRELEILEVEARLAGLIGADVFDDDSSDSSASSDSRSVPEER